jgi:DNA-binding response OmpR family regulator
MGHDDSDRHLPRCHQAAPAGAHVSVLAEAVVLIVDDDAGSRTVLRLACESVGVEVVEAATGRVALESADAGSFALILLDLGLPDMPGLDVCRSLRAQDVVTPIIIVSASCGPAEVELGLAAGADDYIGKPYRMPKLLAVIQAHAHPGDTGLHVPGLPAGRIPVTAAIARP